MAGVTRLNLKQTDFFPSEVDIVHYLRSKPHYKISRSDIVRAFGLQPSRIGELKELLKSMRKKNIISKVTGNFYKHTPHADNQIVMVKLLEKISENLFNGQLLETTHSEIYFKIPIYMNKKKKNYRTNDIVSVKLKETSKKGYYGKVVDDTKIFQEMIGVLETDENSVRVLPINKKQRWTYQVVVNNDLQYKAGDLVKFKLIDKNSSNYKRHHVEIIKVLCESLHDIKDMSIIALEEHHIPYHFSEKVIDEANKISEITYDNKSSRVDLTHLPFITIDPVDAKDHDDAVFAYPVEETKGCIVYVAIADVAAYVTSGSDIDKTAQKRGNSVYLPDRVVPMLPEKLSNNLCSLKQGQKRPVLVVKMEFDEQGNKLSHVFNRAVIECRANYSYEDIYKCVNDKPSLVTDNHVKDIINPLIASYDILKIAHQRRQPLNLDLPEYQILLDELRRPIDVIRKERVFTHKLIEEFMIWANVCAAETLEKAEISFLYRTHEVPPRDKISSLREVLKNMNISFKQRTMVTSEMFNLLLYKSQGTGLEEIISKMVLRCQCQAVYSAKNQGHFGLNLQHYAHFTSPIRRYADLIVHRALIKALKLGNDGLTPREIESINEIADHISTTERKAIVAELETKDRFLAEYLKPQLGNRFKARVSGISSSGIFVKLPDSGAEGFISASSIGVKGSKRKYFEPDQDRLKFVDKYSKRYFILGQLIEVILVSVTPITGGMLFEISDDNQSLKPQNETDDKKNRKKNDKKKLRTQKR